MHISLAGFNTLTCLFQIKKVGTSWDHVEKDMPFLGTAETSVKKTRNLVSNNIQIQYE